jgi:signal transduction histidine kinase
MMNVLLPQGEETSTLELLEECGREMRAASEPSEVFRQLFGPVARKLIGFRKGYVAGIDLVSGTVRLLYLIDEEEWLRDGDAEHVRTWIGHSRPVKTPDGRLVSWLVDHKRPYLSSDYGSDETFSSRLREQLVLHTVLVSPIVVHAEVLGYVLLDFVKAPSDQQLRIQDQLITFAALPAMQSFWLTKYRKEIEYSVKYTMLGQQAGALLHDLKAPMNRLRGLITLLELTTAQKAPSQDKTVKAMKNELDHIEYGVSNLLSFARTYDLRRKPYSPRLLVEKALSHASVPSDWVTFSGDGWETLLFVDPNKLRLVMTNIFVNALQAVSGKPHPSISVNASAEEKEVKIVITDNGPGFSEEMLAVAFEPFTTSKLHGKRVGPVGSRTVRSRSWGTNCCQKFRHRRSRDNPLSSGTDLLG